MRLAIFARLLPSYATIQEVHILNVHSSPYEKTEKDFLIVACIIVADVSATIIRKFRDQGSKFSNETQRVCLRPMLLYQEVTILNVPSSTYVKRRKTSHSSMRESSRNSATFTRKNQDPRLDF